MYYLCVRQIFKHSHLSEILAYYLTYTPIQSRRHKRMTLKNNILHSEKSSQY